MNCDFLRCSTCCSNYRKVYQDVCMAIFGERFASSTYYDDDGVFTFSDEIVYKFGKFHKALELFMREVIESISFVMFIQKISVDDLNKHRLEKYPNIDRLSALHGKFILEKTEVTLLDSVLYLVDDCLYAFKRGIDICDFLYNNHCVTKADKNPKIYVGKTPSGIEAMIIKLFLRCVFNTDVGDVYCDYKYIGFLLDRDLKKYQSQPIDIYIIIGDTQWCDQLGNLTPRKKLVITCEYKKGRKGAKIRTFEDRIMSEFRNIPVKFLKEEIGEVCLYEAPPICVCVSEIDNVVHHDIEFAFNINFIDRTYCEFKQEFKDRHKEGYDVNEDDSGTDYCDACGTIGSEEEYNGISKEMRIKSHIPKKNLYQHLPRVLFRVLFADDGDLFRAIKAYDTHKLTTHVVATGAVHHLYYIETYFTSLIGLLRPSSFSKYVRTSRPVCYYRDYYGANFRLIYNPLREGKDNSIERYFIPHPED